ncbi:MAG: thioesterase [Chlorobiaceae bacterium]|jgi:thioesterase domain-containing protein|nr:thioesterase [Chlorobiaceae bacterium]
MEKKLQDILTKAIPLTQAMGITVERYSGRELTILAPLANNFNHLGTAFGGSLYIACVLSCWGLLYLRLREKGVKGSIVIGKGCVEYLSPVTGDIIATGTMPPEEEFSRFLDSYSVKGKARITLRSVIEAAGGGPAVRFEGEFALVRMPQSSQ